MLWRVQTSWESTHRWSGCSKRSIISLESEDGTELLQSHEKAWMDYRIASYGWAKKVVFWDEIYSWWSCYEYCKNYKKKKDLEYYTNFLDKAIAKN